MKEALGAAAPKPRSTLRIAIPNLDGNDDAHARVTAESSADARERYQQNPMGGASQHAANHSYNTAQARITSEGAIVQALWDSTPGPTTNRVDIEPRVDIEANLQGTLGSHIWATPNIYSQQHVYSQIRGDMYSRAGIKRRVKGCVSGVTEHIQFCDPPMAGIDCNRPLHGIDLLNARRLPAGRGRQGAPSPKLPDFFPCEFDEKKPIKEEVERIRSELGEVPELTDPSPRDSAKLYNEVEKCRRAIERALKHDPAANTTQYELNLSQVELELEYAIKVESMRHGQSPERLHDLRKGLARQAIDNIATNRSTPQAFAAIDHMLKYLYSIWKHHYDVDFSPAFNRLLLFQRLLFHDSWLQINGREVRPDQFAGEAYKHLWAQARRLKWFCTIAKHFEMPYNFHLYHLNRANELWEDICLEGRDLARRLGILNEHWARFPRRNHQEAPAIRATVPDFVPMFDGAGDDPNDGRGGQKQNVRFKSRVPGTPEKKNYADLHGLRTEPVGTSISSRAIREVGQGIYDPNARFYNYGGPPPDQMGMGYPGPMQTYPGYMPGYPSQYPPHMQQPPPYMLQEYPPHMQQYPMVYAQPVFEPPPPRAHQQLQHPKTMKIPVRNDGPPAGGKGEPIAKICAGGSEDVRSSLRQQVAWRQSEDQQQQRGHGLQSAVQERT